MNKSDKPVANKLIVLREEFDDWAILFDPDSGEGYGVNPVSVYIWKLLDGNHTVPDIVQTLRENCDGVPDNAEDFVTNYIAELEEKGMVGYDAAAKN